MVCVICERCPDSNKANAISSGVGSGAPSPVGDCRINRALTEADPPQNNKQGEPGERPGDLGIVRVSRTMADQDPIPFIVYEIVADD